MEIIRTNQDRCVNCNKCINVCPTQFANVVKPYEDKFAVYVNHDLCIGCAACLDACDHQARDYVDDTELFMKNLASGEQISLLVAPSAKFNFSDLDRLLGYLRHCGVRLIYDVSFGADITTWGYLRALEKFKLESIVAQPCPVVVNYIEHYIPETISRLAKVQSPLMCTAIYLREYLDVTDKLAFLSPCLAKISEINDNNNANLVQYNVTFTKMLAYLKKHNIDLTKYQPITFDDIGASLGVIFSRPGGLRENVQYYVPGAWVRQIEGVEHLYNYLQQYSERMQNKRNVPLLVDCLNCINGCNLGTGTTREVHIDDIEASMSKVKLAHLQRWEQAPEDLFSMFDRELELTKFLREYEDKSRIIDIKQATEEEYNVIFNSMLKTDEESRNVNCYACGYHSCQMMAQAIFNKFSVRENCFRYNQAMTKIEQEESMIIYEELQRMNDLLEQKVNERTIQLKVTNDKLERLLRIDDLTNMPNRMAFDEQLLREWQRSLREQQPLSLILFDIDYFKQYNDNYGHVQGDECLRMIAKKLLDCVEMGRGTDFVARYGGEEFVVILPNTDTTGALIKAERIRKAVESLRIKHEFSRACDVVTISLGVNTIVAQVDDKLKEFIKGADKAMYLCKARGRNCVAHAT